jgi:hypothetical protein
MKKISDLNQSSKKIIAEQVSEEQDKKVEDIAVTEEAIKEVTKSLTLTKQEEWEVDLKAFGMTVSEAAVVLDTVITSGFYEETYRYGKTIFKLRTRTATDSDRLIEMIQEFDPRSPGVLQHLIGRVNLASSLRCFGDKSFSFTTPTDSNRRDLDSEFNERYSFISSLPQATFFSLCQVLERFDKRVQLATDPRSLENF